MTQPNPRPDAGSPPATPRWVKISGIIVIALVLVFVAVHLAGGGMGGHAPLLLDWTRQP